MYAFRGYNRNNDPSVIVEKTLIQETSNEDINNDKDVEDDTIVTYTDEVLSIYSERYEFSERYWIPGFEKHHVSSDYILRLPDSVSYKIMVMLEYDGPPPDDEDEQIHEDVFITIDTAKICYCHRFTVQDYDHQYPTYMSTTPDVIIVDLE